MTESEAPQPMSRAERLANIILSPSEAFRDVARRPDFLFPLITLVAVSVAATEAMLAKIGTERIIRNSLEQSGRASNMSSEQIQQAVERSAGVAAVITHIVGVLATPIFLLVIAAIGLLLLNAIFGAQASFLHVFSSVCYAGLIRLLTAAMFLPMIFFGDPEHFNPENPVPTNPGFFLDPHSLSKPLMVLAGSADIVTLWFLVLVAIGLREVSGGKVKARSIFLAFAGLWVLLSLGRAGLAALM